MDEHERPPGLHLCRCVLVMIRLDEHGFDWRLEMLR